MKSITIAVVALFTAGCGQQHSLTSPSGATPGASTFAHAPAPATGLRFEPFIDGNLNDRAAVALRPAANGVEVVAYNLGANGWAAPVASVQLVIRYDQEVLAYFGVSGADGWTVGERSTPGLVSVTFRRLAGDVTGDIGLGHLAFRPADGARVGSESTLEMARLWQDDGCIARAADGRYSQVNDFGGGIMHLTGSGN